MTVTPYLQSLLDKAEASDAQNSNQFTSQMGGEDAIKYLIVAILAELTTATTP